MPETLFVKDFSAGWCPSDDAVNGRPNALLKMDNLELDVNGALTLCGGTSVKYSGYPSDAHTLFSRYLNNVRYDYSAHVDGSIYRNGVSLASGGDASNAAFGTAFNFTLMASGSKRYKDDATTLRNLGIVPPAAGPTMTQSALNAPWAVVSPQLVYASIGANPGFVQVAGTSSNAGGSNYLNLQTGATGGSNPGLVVIQSYGNASSDCTVIGSVAGTGISTDEDFVTLNGFTPNPFGMALQFDVLLVAPDNVGDIVSDYYTFTVADISQTASFDSYSGAFSIRIPRNQFVRMGGGAQNWSTVYGIRLTFLGAPATNINVWGLMFGEPVVIQGGTVSQFGTYQYAQVNVYNSGSYIAKSTIGPASKVITINGNCALVTPRNPTLDDAQCNEAWIYRRSVGVGNLSQWYRVLVFVAAGGWASQYDSFSDQTALTLNITINLNLISTASTGITDKIYDIVGPIQGRWYYFTTNFMYPSDINDPDLVDASLAVRLTGSNSELLMWARAVSASVVLVGTTAEVYLLTGTFTTFPDNSIDVYYQPLGVKFPPLTYDAVSYGGAVFYLASDGWRSITPTTFGTTYSAQNNQLLVSPNTDRLYRGESCYGYTAPSLKITPGSVRFPVAIGRNKLWCFITGTNRCEVYDFIRQYWRTFNYALGDVGAATSTQDGQIISFYINDNKLREIGILSSKLIDGSTKQTFNALLTYKDNGKPRQRKDTYTFKSRCYTSASGNISVSITNEKGVLSSGLGTLTSATTSTEQFFNLQGSSIDLAKSYEIALTGTVNDVTIEDLSIDFDARPVPVTFLRLQGVNYSTTARKRLYTVPFQIDTLNNAVKITPVVDGTGITSLVVTSTRKQSFDYQFTLSGGEVSPIGVDYEWLIDGQGNEFEFFGFEEPRNLEVFPDPRYSHVIPVTNFGTTSRKRLRVRRFVLDPLATSVTFTPIIDGVAQNPQNYAGAGKRTCFYFYTADQIGIDFSGTFSAAGPFELWEVLPPEEGDIEKFPDRVEFMVMPVTNFGNTGRKRLRVRRFVLDTIGSNVAFTPIIDGVAQPFQLYNNAKQTCFYWYTSDQIGVDFSGTFSGTGPFELWDILPPQDGDIELFPDRLEYMVVPVTNFGSPVKKRVRGWPFMINTFGQNITFTPIVDRVQLAPITFNTPDKQTIRVFYKTDVFGIDFSGIWQGGLFELWQIGEPDVVQSLPPARQFDQVGPMELFRIGKISKVEVRVLPFNGTSIPFNIYFSDNSAYVGTFNVVANVEQSVFVDVPKGTTGSILRVELGPTAFDFHRYYMKFLVAPQAGQENTENQWITIPGMGMM
jgi:hypothetical protein